MVGWERAVMEKQTNYLGSDGSDVAILLAKITIMDMDGDDSLLVVTFLNLGKTLS